MAEDAAAAAAALDNGTGEPKVSKNALKKQVGRTTTRVVQLWSANVKQQRYCCVYEILDTATFMCAHVYPC